MHNIAMVFVQMGQWEEAVATLEYIMTEQANHQDGLHLILCSMIVHNKPRMKKSFSLLLAVPFELDNESKYNEKQVRAFSSLI